MPRPRTELILAAAFAIAGWACQGPSRDGVRPPPPGDARQAPHAPSVSSAAGRGASLADAARAAAVPSVSALLAAPAAQRWSNPGGLRWRLALDAKATFVRWTPLGGLLVSVGNELENVTSRGVKRWSRVAGSRHKAFLSGDQEIVWSPAFGKLYSLLARGGDGWVRPWSAEVTAGPLGAPLLVDAATVAAVGPFGDDKWRVAVRGLRKLSSPYSCADGMLFQGSRGLAGVAVTVSSRGSVVREVELDRGSIVVGASSSCEPLVWNGADLGLLDPRGIYRWRSERPSLPVVVRVESGFLLASGGPEKAVRLDRLTEDGRTAWSAELPISGRFTRLAAIEGALAGALLVGMCLNAESACSNQDGDRGPFNTLLRVTEGGEAAMIERHAQGHLDAVRLAEGGYAVASSAEETSTELSLRDASGTTSAAVTLPGRLSAGPFEGPGGEIYVATCEGWKCVAPYALFAVTGDRVAVSPDVAPAEVEKTQEEIPR